MVKYRNLPSPRPPWNSVHKVKEAYQLYGENMPEMGGNFNFTTPKELVQQIAMVLGTGSHELLWIDWIPSFKDT